MTTTFCMYFHVAYKIKLEKAGYIEHATYCEYYNKISFMAFIVIKMSLSILSTTHY